MAGDREEATDLLGRVAIDGAMGAEAVRDSEAEYTLEYPAICPRCARDVTALKVARLLRTRVNFVSTLPRRGRVLTCPHCRTILSAELTLA